MEIYGIIYCITCLLNGMKYVGQTTQLLGRRIDQHKRGDQYIDHAIRKYGLENFKVEVLEECTSREQLNEREKFWIVELNCKDPNGYNLTDGGEGTGGLEFTPEHCANISAAKKGKKRKPFSSEHCVKLSISRRGNSPFSNLLKKIDNYQLSYSKLAELINVSRVSISFKISGKRNFTSTEWEKHAKTFDCSVEYLMKRDDNLPTIFATELSSHERYLKISAPLRNISPFRNLLAEIDRRKFSYATLDALLGWPKDSIGRKMRCKTNFSSDEWAKLAEFFGCSVEYLKQRDDSLPITLNAEPYSPEHRSKLSISHRDSSLFKNLLVEIDKCHLSYTALAKIMGLSRPSISSKMLGNIKFSSEDITKLVEIFGKPAEYLMQRDD